MNLEVVFRIYDTDTVLGATNRLELQNLVMTGSESLTSNGIAGATMDGSTGSASTTGVDMTTTTIP